MRMIAIVAGAVLAAVPLSVSRAGHETPLSCAAEEYREAARDFQKHVFRLDCFGHYDRRLADRLGDAASRLRDAARHAKDLDRLYYEWDETRCLEHRLEAAVSRQGGFARHPQLADCWQRVLRTSDRLARELQASPYFRGGVIDHHHRGRSPLYGTAEPPRIHGPSRDRDQWTERDDWRDRRSVGRARSHLAVPRHAQPVISPIRPSPIRPAPVHEPTTYPRRHRVESRRADVGEVIVGAVLSRLLN